MHTSSHSRPPSFTRRNRRTRPRPSPPKNRRSPSFLTAPTILRLDTFSTRTQSHIEYRLSVAEQSEQTAQSACMVCGLARWISDHVTHVSFLLLLRSQSLRWRAKTKTFRPKKRNSALISLRNVLRWRARELAQMKECWGYCAVSSGCKWQQRRSRSSSERVRALSCSLMLEGGSCDSNSSYHALKRSQSSFAHDLGSGTDTHAHNQGSTAQRIVPGMWHWRPRRIVQPTCRHKGPKDSVINTDVTLEDISHLRNMARLDRPTVRAAWTWQRAITLRRATRDPQSAA